MKKRNLILTLALILIFTTACNSSTTSTPVTSKEDFVPITLKFGNQHPVDSIASIADKEIAAEIEEATKGRVKVQLYTDSALGDYTNIFEEVMVGSIDMAHITAVETYDARMSGSMFPYLGSNYEELQKAYDPSNYLFQTIFESAQNLGIRTFGFFCEGFSGVGVNKALQNANLPNAEKGVVVRVPGLDNFAVGITELGFRTSTIAYSDTYTSIQTGVVDGWAAGPANLNYLYFRDVITHYYDYMTNQEATQILMNEKTFLSLLPEDQEAVTEIIQRKCRESFKLAEEDDGKYMKMMEDYGIEIIRFTDEERQIFADAVRQNVWPKLAKNSSQEFLDNILESLNN